jgi:hypothetical protein
VRVNEFIEGRADAGHGPPDFAEADNPGARPANDEQEMLYEVRQADRPSRTVCA